MIFSTFHVFVLNSLLLISIKSGWNFLVTLWSSFNDFCIIMCYSNKCCTSGIVQVKYSIVVFFLAFSLWLFILFKIELPAHYLDCAYNQVYAFLPFIFKGFVFFLSFRIFFYSSCFICPSAVLKSNITAIILFIFLLCFIFKCSLLKKENDIC